MSWNTLIHVNETSIKIFFVAQMANEILRAVCFSILIHMYLQSGNPNMKCKYPDQLNFIEALASSLIGDNKSAKGEMNVILDLAQLPTLSRVIKKIFLKKQFVNAIEPN